jgi:hypothetical protein
MFFVWWWWRRWYIWRWLLMIYRYILRLLRCWDALNLYAAFCSSRTLVISSGPLDCLRCLSLCAFVRAVIIEIYIFLTKHSFQKLSSTQYCCAINETNSKNSNVNNWLVTLQF